uniref:UPAR/Ly6 domain-containing protein n=1 Tax=Gouania willdenowi TaxID=441366 RepID=A0A8C5DLS7_GOUWI
TCYSYYSYYSPVVLNVQLCCVSLSAPAPLPLNGQECHACLPGTTQCSFQIRCFGVEDRCFAAIVSSPSGTSPVIGCTSSNLCNDASSLGNVLYSDGSSQVVSGPICCQGSLCNTYPSFSPPAVTTTVPPQVTSPGTPNVIMR